MTGAASSSEGYSDFDFLDVKVDDSGICTIRFDRPEKLNACTADGHDELPRVLRAIQQDRAVKVAVVTGNGRAFSVGGDLSLLEEAHRNRGAGLAELLAAGRELVLAHVDLTKPIIAAVNGDAMGAGAVFALLCDVIVVERSARISDGHLRAAIAAGDGGVLAWPLAVGLVKAKWYLMTGDWISAEEAERIGLVTEVVADGASLDRANGIARRFAAGPAQAISYTKIALNQWLRAGVPTAFDLSAALEVLSMVSDDAGEALRSLRETGRGAMPEP
jgi:enoyl-CoA hydratase